MHCILIAGPPACGKSTFASFLGKRLAFPVISKDEIKEVLFDCIGFNSRHEKRRLDMCATELMCLFAKKELELNGNVILDNNFESSSIPSLQKLIDVTGAEPITVRFDGDMDEIYKRFVARDMSPLRHRGHVVNSKYPEDGSEKEYVPMGAETFKRRYTQRGMTVFSMGKLITVWCTGSDKPDFELVYAKIKEAMEKK